MPVESWPKLKISEQPRVYRTVDVDKTPFNIGRHGGCNLKLTDPCVSRYHAEIQQEVDQFKLVDTNSKSGTLVNGLKVEFCVLKHGDKIQFGGSSLPEIVFLTRAEREEEIPALSGMLSVANSLAGKDLLNISKLLESARLFSAGLPLGEVLDLVLDTALDVTKAERSFLVLKDEQGKINFERGRDFARKQLSKEDFMISSTVLKQVVDSGRKLLMSDNMGTGPIAQAESIVDLELRTIVCLPLQRLEIKDSFKTSAAPPEVIGALYLDSTVASERFSKISEGILDSLAGDAAAVIENARLFRQAREKARLESELATAQEIQAALLPQINEPYDFFQAFARNLPCRHISGDYYDLIKLPNGSYAFVIADVAGKGVSAAILGSIVQGFLFAEMQQTSSLVSCMENANRYLVHRTDTARFVTLFCAVLAPDGELTFVNAGHNPPLLIRPDGQSEELAAAGVVLGVLESAKYEEKKIRLQPQDLVCLFTDGVTEAPDSKGHQFGEDRLIELLKTNFTQPLREVVEEIIDSIAEHSSDAPRSDDVTLLVLRYTGSR
jgi:serine phosphatase RsbU (regulator of sigma subunit)/pSer/pThr/pTyr-binding forkhead associated (FHA) protein